MNTKSVWENLSAVDVSKHTEKKNGLTYLSWAWAWAEVKSRYPDAVYDVKKNEAGLPYFESDAGYMCFVSVTIECMTHEMWLPVMDGANKAMKSAPYEYSARSGTKTVEAATMFDVNKTIMRCLVKCLAMFGLGHYIYAGEDIPPAPVITQNQAAELRKALTLTDLDEAALCKTVRINSLEELEASRFGGAMTYIETKAKGAA